MKNIIILLSSLFSFGSAYSLKIGDRLMECEYNPDGTYDFCRANTGKLESIPSLKNRNDVNLTYEITYNYSCSDNISQYVGIKSENGSVSLFKYNENMLKINSFGNLSIVDINPYKTYSAQFVRDCNLHIKDIKADLSQETVNSLIKDACYMGVLNTLSSQAQIVNYLSQSMVNNYGSLPINQLKGQLRNLQLALQGMIPSVRNDNKIKRQIENIIGRNDYPDQVGTVNYIIKNSSSWGGNSVSMRNNLNILNNNLSSIMADISDSSRDTVAKIYANGESIANSSNDFKSAKLPLEYLKYQYSISKGEDPSSFKAPNCFSSL